MIGNSRKHFLIQLFDQKENSLPYIHLILDHQQPHLCIRIYVLGQFYSYVFVVYLSVMRERILQISDYQVSLQTILYTRVANSHGCEISELYN